MGRKEIEAYLEKRRNLTKHIKSRIIEMLQLPIEEDKMDLDCPLFGSGFGLDSVDSVALAAMIETDFSIRVLDSDISLFRSINSIADYIMSKNVGISDEYSEIEAVSPLEAKLSDYEVEETGDVKADHDFQDYQALRNNAGLIELPSPALIRIKGPDAEQFIDFIVAGNVVDLPVGSLLNSVILNEDGTILSIIWLARQESDYLLIADFDKSQSLLESIHQYCNKKDVEILDLAEKMAILAVVGPKAQEMVVDLFEEDLLRLGYGEFETLEWKGFEIFIGRYGGSGEFDYRFIIPVKAVPQLVAEIEDAGSLYHLRTCSPDILKTLMIEMKSIHQGSMVIPGCIPSQVDLQWMVDFRKENFLGRKIFLERHKQNHPHTILLTADGEVETQEGAPVFMLDAEVGFVKTSAYSFILSKTVFFAYITHPYACPNLQFQVRADNRKNVLAISRSAPLFLTKTIVESLNI